MHNVRFELPDRPGMLAIMGEALGTAGISLEGGGVFSNGAVAIANFLVEDGAAARHALERAGIRVDSVDEVVMLRLDQERPGQLGLGARRMAEACVNIRTQYSDHANQLVMVVEPPAQERATAVARAYSRSTPEHLDNQYS